MSPLGFLAEKIDEFERWKDIVADGNLQNLTDMTFLEFMAKLDRTIERAEKEQQQAQQRLNDLKHRNRY